MKASEVILALTSVIEREGDLPVTIETATRDGLRIEQHVFDVLSGNDRVILVSKEALDNDPLLGLPAFPNLGLTSEDGLPQ